MKRIITIVLTVLMIAAVTAGCNQKVGSGPVFAPPEEFDFVKRFILERLPDGAEVICR